MKNNIFVARLARNTAATVMIGAGAIPSYQANAVVQPPAAAQGFAFPQAILPEIESQASTRETFVLTMSQSPSEWDKKLEKEFRALALAEAKGTISSKEASTLEQLSHWRDQLLCPQTVNETLLQMKRDRLLVRMENLLQEYVELQEATAQKGFAP